MTYLRSASTLLNAREARVRADKPNLCLVVHNVGRLLRQLSMADCARHSELRWGSLSKGPHMMVTNNSDQLAGERNRMLAVLPIADCKAALKPKHVLVVDDEQSI